MSTSQFDLQHNGNQLTVSIVRSYRRHDLYLYQETGDDVYIALPQAFLKQERELPAQQPTLQLTGDLGSQLMDQLWQQGFRPSSAIASTGQLEAIGKHLADMRALVAALSKIQLP